MLVWLVCTAAVFSLGGLILGWNRDEFRAATWGYPRESLRSYGIRKATRIALILLAIALLFVAAHFLAVAVSDDTNPTFAVGAVVVTMIFPPLGAALAALLWWVFELLGYSLRRGFGGQP